jgi:dihydrofolate reductase
MRKVILDITMSLDGFIAGPNINPSQPMGENGERLHDWLFGSKTDLDASMMKEFENSGAVIVGGKTYHNAIDIAWGGVTPFKMPAFVLTSRVPKPKEGFTFVPDGIEQALIQARAVAGEKNVWVMGGAHTIQQFLQARLFDELGIHIAPILMGSGTRLFENIGSEKIQFENTQTIKTPGAVHLRFRPLPYEKTMYNILNNKL